MGEWGWAKQTRGKKKECYLCHGKKEVSEKLYGSEADRLGADARLIDCPICKRGKPRIQNYRSALLDGYRFDSQLEANTYGVLKIKQSQGEIRDLEVKPSGVRITLAGIPWHVDFRCFDIQEFNCITFDEAKGDEGERYRLIRSLWEFYGLGPLRVWKDGGRRGPTVAYRVLPKWWLAGEKGPPA